MEGCGWYFKISYTIFTFLKLKKLISFLLLVTIAVTALPIKQVGKLLSGNQLTEEINEHGNDQPEKKENLCPHNPYCFLEGYESSSPFMAANTEYLHFSINIPVHPAGEIHAPPPNLA